MSWPGTQPAIFVQTPTRGEDDLWIAALGDAPICVTPQCSDAFGGEPSMHRPSCQFSASVLPGVQLNVSIAIIMMLRECSRPALQAVSMLEKTQKLHTLWIQLQLIKLGPRSDTC